MNMKSLIVALLLAPCLGWAHSDQEIRKDIERHRQMAAAHEQAARCLESGTKPEDCQKQLVGACKGLGIGKYCGMKHSH